MTVDPHHQRLRDLIVLDIVISLGGSLFSLIVWLTAFDSGWMLVLAALTAGTAATLGIARSALARSRVDLALGLFAIANWGATLGVALIGTFAWPLMLLAAVLPAIVVVPYAGTAQVRLAVAASLAVAVGVTLLGNLQDFSNVSDDAPEWATQLVVAFFAPLLSALVVFTAWQNSARLQTALAGEVATNRELAESRRRVVVATDRERRRIERDLHDGAQQRLVALSMRVRHSRDLVETDPAAAAEVLDRMQDDVRAAQAELRSLVQGVYPPVLVQHGLPAALRAAVEASPLRIRLDLHDVGRHSSEVEAAVYFCCLEALQNSAKHAGVDAEVVVRLDRVDDLVRFEVCDDGVGFDTNAAGSGHGFVNITDRIEAAEGGVAVESAPCRGTTVSGWIPVGATG